MQIFSNLDAPSCLTQAYELAYVRRITNGKVGTDSKTYLTYVLMHP